MAEYSQGRKVISNPAAEKAAALQKVVNIVWLLFSVVEIILGMRVFLKLIAANPNVAFTDMVYSVSSVFMVPFEGITISPAANGVVFDIPAIVAILVYALVGWVVTSLIWYVFKPTKRDQVVEQRNIES